MLDKIDNLLAISSLQSPVHATKKDPKIISILWFIGKRCNYDCSYCTEYYHDNYSPHIKKEKAFIFIDQLEEYCASQNKKFQLNITGGEPFVHPNILEILKKAKEKINLTQLAIISNGSLPISIYEAASKYVTNMTISLHLEQKEIIINQTIEKIIHLNKIKTWFLNVNLMAVPGKFDLIKSVIEKFNTHEIKFVLRQINPPDQNEKEVLKKSNLPKNYNMEIENKNFSKNKILHTVKRNESLSHEHYYSKVELEYLKNFENTGQWKNIKLYFENSQFETNTDDIKRKNFNSWKNWLCWIGIDSLYVQHTGEIFRGFCMQGELIGKIGEKLRWPTEPITCPLKWCTCSTDMQVRKIKSKEHKKLIDD